MGETVYDFIWRLRLEKAARVLVFDRSVSITAIAKDCGFSSSQNFAKAFCAKYGCTASEFRKMRNPEHSAFYELRQKDMVSNPGNISGNSRNESGQVAEYLFNESCAHKKENLLFTGRSVAMLMNVKVIEVPSYRVAYVRAFGSYEPGTIATAFSKLLKMGRTAWFFK